MPIPASTGARFGDIGNVLRHADFEVDPKVRWRIVKDRLPELDRVIACMIEDQS